MKLLDLFAGIGGFRLGMTMAGHKPIGYVEWDKFARKSYEAMYETEGEWTAHDITAVSDEHIRSLRGRIDIITGGFPCQAFSIAGKRKGFDDTRGTLFFEIARFASIIQPRYLFLENVKGLLNHDSGNTFETILRTLDELRYDVEWDVLNSKDFGVPQNRERVFIIGHFRGQRTRKVFPITSKTNKYSAIEKSTKTAIARTFTAGGNSAGNHSGMTMIKVGELNIKANDQNKRVYSTRGISPCLTTMEGGGQKPKIIQPVLTPDRLENGSRIRKLTPKECWRLQGFPDELFEKAAEVNSDSQLYKQAGNSVTVNVIYEIAKRLS